MSGILNLTPVCISATVAASDSITFAVKVPGTFNGLTPGSSGRFIKRIQMWAGGGGSDGDRAHSMQILDTDSILAGLGVSGAFANYPVVQEVGDIVFSEAGASYRGVYLPPGVVVELGNIDPNALLFVPSGMYVSAIFTSGATIPIGKKIFVNIFWGTFS